jgi:hypothetical protein
MKDGFNSFCNFILCRTLWQQKVTEQGKMWLFTYESERNWMMPLAANNQSVAKFKTPN